MLDITRAWCRRALVAALIAAGALPVMATAADDAAATATPDKWQFAVLVYGYLPQISGKVSAPIAGTGGSFTLDQSDILDHLKMTAMGAFDAHYGHWGLFADALYLDLGQSKTGFRDFTLPDGFPVGSASARVNLDVKSWIVTWGLEYRLVMQPDLILDSLIGGRYLYLKQRLDWNITGDIGTNPPQVRVGNRELSGDKVDAVVGFKGDWKFAGERPWALPFYADIGGGASKLTWQVVVGIGYHVGAWEIDALYREINYHLNSSGAQDLNIKGPALGAAYRW